MKHYHRLTQAERYQIVALLKSGNSIRRIANILNKHPSTISREVKRNLSARGYCPEIAQIRTRARREKIGPPKKVQGPLKDYIIDKLNKDWSPEQIKGRLHLDNGERISHELIYRFIYSDYKDGGKLWQKLRRRRRKRLSRSRAKRTYFIGKRSKRTWIEERPKEVENRNRLGDVEIDTVEGRRRGGVLLVAVDRCSRKTHIRWVERKSSSLVHDALVGLFSNQSLKTITNDNGPEFSLHDLTAKALKTPIYFSRPHQSWQRGTVENTNGLIRQYFPKRQEIDPSKVYAVQETLNNRPRKCLGYRTPNEVHGT